MTEPLDVERHRLHVRDIRYGDIDALRSHFSSDARVLEIGGGNGFQASVVASWGCIVDSIDVHESARSEPSFYPVRVYDGKHIPFSDATFDIAYSSAVLEHVRRPVELLREVRRVLKPGGRGIHIVPSAGWRFWTALAHYPHLVRRLLKRKSNCALERAIDQATAAGKPRPAWRRILIPGAHGEYPSAVSEMYFFSRLRWRHVFVEAGLDVVRVSGNHLFYTGYRLLPGLGNGVRWRMAGFLGSACHVFETRRSP
jgi:SAM-dependent methyltransferase